MVFDVIQKHFYYPVQLLTAHVQKVHFNYNNPSKILFISSHNPFHRLFAGGSRQADRAAAAAAPIRFTFITAVPDRIPDRFSPVPAVPSNADEPAAAAVPRTTTTAPQPPTASPLPSPTPPPPTSSAAVLPAAVPPPRSRLNTDSSLPPPSAGGVPSIASEPLISRRPILARDNEIENRFAPLPSATVPVPTASPFATEVEGGDEGPTRNRKA
jgi:hypothetical protein